MIALLGLLAALDGPDSDVPGAAPGVHVRGETTDGRSVTYPDDAHGRPLVLIVSFTREAGDRTARWSDALSTSVGARAAIVGVAVLDGVPGFLRGMVKRSIDKEVGAPQPGKPGFVTTTDGRSLRAAAPAGTANDPVVYVFRADGTLVTAVRSPWSAAAEAHVENAIR
jgi:hypothetical protein